MRTPGAILLRYDKQFQHIVFVGHDRTTVEARGAAYGVCRHVVDGRGFQYGIKISGVVYKEVA
jgi:thiamine pyrophosphokinase